MISYILLPNAGIAQLVERNLAKVDVAGSNPVSRSVPVTGQGTFGNRAEGSYNNTSSLKWPRRPQSHQVAGFLFFSGVSVMWGCSKVFSGSGVSIQSRDSLISAPYPSGKGEVCKTFMRRFDSARRLTKVLPAAVMFLSDHESGFL